MNPTFFGRPPLFGIHHHPAGKGEVERDAVLVCPPLGHEHTRAHRAVRVLAQALSRAGHHVLRFDPRGLGDSWGDTADGGVQPWCEDIDLALLELVRRSPTDRVSVVGLRVGGALAASSLARRGPAPPAVRTLVLWDPVLSGREFLQVAQDFEEKFLNDPYRFPERAGTAPQPRRVSGDHLLGYPYPEAVRTSLERLDLTRLDPWPSARTSIVLSRPWSTCEEWIGRLRASGRAVECEVVEGTDGAWEDYAQHEKTLRPGRLVSAIVETLREETV
jgi:alpha-beta hydrolase superfamily lysophospholipase